MAYQPGEYVGLFASEYQALLALNISAINDFITNPAYFEQVPGENFYLYLGDDMDFIRLLEDNDVQPGQYCTYFVYLQSTWSVHGF